jgi:hypothetical protein
MIMQIFENDYIFLVFCITIFPEQSTKEKQSRDQNDLFINDENT